MPARTVPSVLECQVDDLRDQQFGTIKERRIIK